MTKHPSVRVVSIEYVDPVRGPANGVLAMAALVPGEELPKRRKNKPIPAPRARAGQSQAPGRD